MTERHRPSNSRDSSFKWLQDNTSRTSRDHRIDEKRRRNHFSMGGANLKSSFKGQKNVFSSYSSTKEDTINKVKNKRKKDGKDSEYIAKVRQNLNFFKDRKESNVTDGGVVGNRRDTPYLQGATNKLNNEGSKKGSKRRIKVDINMDKLFNSRRINKPVQDLKNDSMDSKSSTRSYKPSKKYKRSLIIPQGIKKPFSLSMHEPSRKPMATKPKTTRAKKSKLSSLREIIGKTKKRKTLMKTRNFKSNSPNHSFKHNSVNEEYSSTDKASSSRLYSLLKEYNITKKWVKIEDQSLKK